LIFGTNALGLILAAQCNRWLLQRFASFGILWVGVAIKAASSLLLVGITVAGLGGFPGMLFLLFFCVTSHGLVQPNAIALALAPYGRRAGSASALIGATQFVMAAAAGDWSASCTTARRCHGGDHRGLRSGRVLILQRLARRVDREGGG